MAEGNGILVIGETQAGELSLASQEILAAGRQVADNLGQELAIGLFGDSLEDIAQSAIALGADRVYAVTHPLLAEFQAELYLAAAETLCKETGPAIVLVARTNQGREVAPGCPSVWAWAWPRTAWKFPPTPPPASCWPIARSMAATPWP